MKLAAGIVLVGLGLAAVIVLLGSGPRSPMFDPVPAGWRE